MSKHWTRPLGLAFLALAVSPVWAADDDSKIKVKEGQKAPEINLPATQIDAVLPDKKMAKTLDLKDLQGKKNVVLFFYPKALTGGCTVESCGFRDKLDDLAKLDTVVIGISTDTVDKQKEFTDKEKLTFPLLADNEMKVTKAFGVVSPKNPKMSGRATFIIDKKGVISKIYETVDPKTHPAEVVKYVKENLAEKK